MFVQVLLLLNRALCVLLEHLAVMVLKTVLIASQASLVNEEPKSVRLVQMINTQVTTKIN